MHEARLGICDIPIRALTLTNQTKATCAEGATGQIHATSATPVSEGDLKINVSEGIACIGPRGQNPPGPSHIPVPYLLWRGVAARVLQLAIQKPRVAMSKLAT